MNRHTPAWPRRLASLLVLAALAALLAGCFNPFDPRISSTRVASAPPPSPNTPANTIRLFVWCWQNRDPDRYAEVFTDDYRFVFGEADSAGNAFRDRPWLREDEMQFAQHLFRGGADQPPASDIQIDFDKTLTPSDDPRPGHNPKWHQTIFTHVDLKITVTGSDGTPSVTPITGNALFYLTRGDSALIPTDLKGFKPDSNRWWIDRWEDKTIATGSPALAQRLRSRRPTTFLGDLPTPAATGTWGWLKALYLTSSN
jgi:hypothetical protein